MIQKNQEVFESLTSSRPHRASYHACFWTSWPPAARWGLRLAVAALMAGLLVRAEAALGPVHPG
jgi:hypothetical protein